jgi:hypothetical protein
MKNLAVIFLLVVVSFAGCRSGSGGPPQGDPSLVVSHHYELVIDGTAYFRQDEVHPGFILGGNTGAWSERLTYPESGELMGGLGHGILRFPGGDAANDYCWVYELEEGEDWKIKIDEYVAFLKENRMKPLFGVNIFDHEYNGIQHNALAEAVALVEYMKDQGLGGGYYELGNENDGPWNAHDGQQLTINEYLEKYIPIAEAMKAADPEIKLLGPAVSGYDNPGQHKPYIEGFIEGMRGRRDLVDYFSYHYYGETWIDRSNNNRINLDRPQSLAGQARDIRGQLAAAGLSDVKLAITEYNAAVWGESNVDKCVIEQGLWLADFIGEAFCHLDMATVWISLTPAYDPVRKPKGDPHALIDESANPPCPAKNYWPCALAFKALANGDRDNPVRVLQVNSPAPTSQMTVYATRAADESWAGVLLINKGKTAVTVEASMDNFPGFTEVRGWRMGEKEYNQGYNNEKTLVEFVPDCEGNVISLLLPPLSLVGISAHCSGE